jgi:hypothetical protein
MLLMLLCTLPVTACRLLQKPSCKYGWPVLYPHTCCTCVTSCDYCCLLISTAFVTDLLRNFDQLTPNQLEAQYQQLVGELKHSSASTAADRAALKADKAAKAAATAAATEEEDADEGQQQQQQEREQQESTLWGM